VSKNLPKLPFRSVNKRGHIGYNPGLQRHHLIPSQALNIEGLAPMFEGLGRQRVGFDDFRRNGMLLPAGEAAAQRLGLPLHRGPHRAYNEMVIERLGAIESSWSRQRRINRNRADQAALMRINLLQRALQQRLLDTRQPLRLNSKDKLGQTRDFSVLDAMAEQLWRAT
jgi:hypothetical protein